MDEREREILRQRQAQISSITSHPGWAANVEEAKRKIEKLKHRAQTLALRHDGADQRELDFIRGQIDALEYSYKMPQGAESRLAKFMEELEAEDAT